MRSKLTLDRLIAAVEASQFDREYLGFCVACGAEHSGVEPDRERMKCETCGQFKVYGAEQLLFMVQG